MKATSTRPAAVLGLDVGKSSHWACLVDRDGEVLASAPVRNREAEPDALFASAPAGTLVVVDQFRNIGSLLRRAPRGSGSPTCLSPPAPRGYRRGQDHERDAAVIARTALGVPDSWSGSRQPSRPPAPSSQRDHVVACAIQEPPARGAARVLPGPRGRGRPVAGGGWSCSPGSAGRGIARSGPGARGPRPPGEAAAASTRPAGARRRPNRRGFLAARIGPRRGRGPEAETAALLEGDLPRVPAHRARHRPEDRGAARGVGRHREVPGPRPPGLVLRHRPEGEEPERR